MTNVGPTKKNLATIHYQDDVLVITRLKEPYRQDVKELIKSVGMIAFSISVFLLFFSKVTEPNQSWLRLVMNSASMILYLCLGTLLIFAKRFAGSVRNVVFILDAKSNALLINGRYAGKLTDILNVYIEFSVGSNGKKRYRLSLRFFDDRVVKVIETSLFQNAYIEAATYSDVTNERNKFGMSLGEWIVYKIDMQLLSGDDEFIITHDKIFTILDRARRYVF